MKTMNYLAASDRFFLDSPGGQYGIAWELARAASRTGHRAALLCGSLEGDPPEGQVTVDGVEVVRYRIPGRSWWKPSRFGDHVRVAAAAYRKHLGNTIWDTVHAHALVSGSLLGTGLPGRRRIFTVHSPATLEQSVNWAGPGVTAALRRGLGIPAIRHTEARALRAANAVHVLSRFSQDELTSVHGPSFAGRVVRIPWWSDTPRPGAGRAEARARLGWPANLPVVFSLRRLVPRMGLDTLVDALGLVEGHQEFLAIIAGEGPERAALERRASSLAARGRVRFTGRLTDEQRDLAYQAADVFVVPTRALECFGMIVLEALAHGCPVIASRAGALPEIMDTVLPGWSFLPGDVASLARLISMAIDGSLRAPKGVDLSTWVDEHYGRARIWPAYEALISG